MRNLIIYFSLFFFVSCFGKKDATQNSASGVALDGYLYLAAAFIDLDGDGIQDGDEPSGSTDASGNFSISSNQDLSTFRVVIKGVENVTIDQDNPGTAITSAFTFLTPPGEFSVASPLTTEIVARMNDGLDKDAAIAAIKSDYGFSDDVDITSDYIAAKQSNSSYQEIHNIAMAITDALKKVDQSQPLYEMFDSINDSTQVVKKYKDTIKAVKDRSEIETVFKSEKFYVNVTQDSKFSYVGEQITITSRAVSYTNDPIDTVSFNKCSFTAFDVDSDSTDNITEISGSFDGGTATDATDLGNGDVTYKITFDTVNDYKVYCTIKLSDGTVRTSTSKLIKVIEKPVTSGVSDGPYLSGCYNQLAAACAGENCAAGAVSGTNNDGFTTQLSGSGYGIWCYDNQASSAASVDLSISGLNNARVATFVFTNPKFTASTESAPTLGDLSNVVVAQPLADIYFESADNSQFEYQKTRKVDVHTQILEENRRILTEELRPPERNLIFFEATQSFDAVGSSNTNDHSGATVNIGDTHTFREGFHCSQSAYRASPDPLPGGCMEYEMAARHICTLSPVAPHSVGRRVVFWVESGEVKNELGARSNPSLDGIFGTGNMFDGQEKVSQADLDILSNIVCTGPGKGGAFDTQVALTADFWTTKDTYFSNTMNAESVNSPIDINILILEPEKCINGGDAADKAAGCNTGWGGYYNSMHTFKALHSETGNPDYFSNQSLVFFMSGSTVQSNPAMAASTLVHEAMHMINMTNHFVHSMHRNSDGEADPTAVWLKESWLEETTAMASEDLIVPHASKFVLSASEYPEGISKVGLWRIPGYAACGADNQNLSEWASLGSSGCAYGMGGSLGAFLNRRYGSAWLTNLFYGYPVTGSNGYSQCATPDLENPPSYECLNAVLRSLNSRSLTSSLYRDNLMLHDELARMGASVFATDESSGKNYFCGYYQGTSLTHPSCAGRGIKDTGLPGGFGYPDKTDLNPSLFGLDLSLPEIGRPVTSSNSFNGSSHYVLRHHLYDSLGESNGDSLNIQGMSIPPGTSMMLIIK